MHNVVKTACAIVVTGFLVTTVAIGEVEAKKEAPGQKGNSGQAVRSAVQETLRERNIPAGPKAEKPQASPNQEAEKVIDKVEQVEVTFLQTDLLLQEDQATEVEEEVTIDDEEVKIDEKEIKEINDRKAYLTKKDLQNQKKALQKERQLERKHNQALAKVEKEALKNRAVEERLYVHGQKLKFDVPPVIREGRVLVPVRAITEGMGARVDWNEESKIITITRDDVTIVFSLDSQTIYVNGEERTIDVAPSIHNNRTLVPIRFISLALGDKVLYDEETGDIDIIEEDAVLEDEVEEPVIEEPIIEEERKEEETNDGIENDVTEDEDTNNDNDDDQSDEEVEEEEVELEEDESEEEELEDQVE
ncbi:copper amine oxidase N-terminal domain-containing protein [Heliorestis acidaminivorans]|uniref:Copper amine oxidase N-terminal domain-containing protein n=1 Tax=Heliorestis acidaminivorans TaxID=553427 RepID=A0A6I0ES82_9FIRM|nr:copper amine oxidase N-terminal domain-containing protein [Heliorestis acidaminivorans]KAB2952635.1 copper amine oxidase N-terminal domain-containing protein [Heliorestis acidaminivorans]